MTRGTSTKATCRATWRSGAGFLSITGKRERNTLAIVGLFTDGFRAALEDWVDCGEPSLTFVAERVEMLLVGPVQRAFGRGELGAKLGQQCRHGSPVGAAQLVRSSRNNVVI